MPVPILMYHAIDEERSVLSVTPARFAAQMAWLHEQGIQVLDLGQLAEQIRSRRSLPRKAVVITFDDGFASVYEHAFPILQQYRFPATVFMVTGYSAGANNWPSQPAGYPLSPLMNWQQLDEISRGGLIVGAHTVTHPFLDQISPSRARSEIVESKHRLEEKLGRPVDRFAYPYGHYNAFCRSVVAEQYSIACTTRLRLASSEDDPLMLPRVETYYLQHPRLFNLLGTPLIPLYVRARRYLRALRRLWRGYA